MLRKLWFTIWYYFRPPWDTGVSPPELLTYLQNHPPGQALDLGCGSGTNAITMAQHGWQVIGIDFASPAVKRGRNMAAKLGVEVDFQVGDVTQLSHLDQEFDLILDIGCFHSLPEPERITYIRNLDRLLAPNGNFLLYAMWNHDQDSRRPGIGPRDLENLSAVVHLVDRADGVDRGVRPSTWLTFRAQEKP